MPQYHIDTISLSIFEDVLSRYASIVPEKLHALDTLRYDTIPASVLGRGQSAGLKKDEVVSLVEWKLKHGTFRPKLLSLVQSNSAESIKTTTQTAATQHAKAENNTTDLSALKTLTNLSGIGPATASLLLSVMYPQTCPFFSDEMYRWTTWDGKDEWKKKIKYNVAEYRDVVKKVGELRKRLGEEVRAVDAERVAWVLGKEGIDVGSADSEHEDEDGSVAGTEKEKMKESEEKEGRAEGEDVGAVRIKMKKNIKRKASDAKTPSEGTRKSARTRK